MFVSFTGTSCMHSLVLIVAFLVTISWREGLADDTA
jgi:hypothetical protein